MNAVHTLRDRLQGRRLLAKQEPSAAACTSGACSGLNKFLRYWQNIRYSLWFVPTIIVFFALLMAVLAVELDTTVAPEMLSRWPRLFGARAEGARGMLEVIATAMITVAGLTFSITVLVLSLAASQYTPRVIRTFMGSRATQAVLGVFVGIFAYCLLVLRSVRGGGEAFIPSISITLATVLALVGIAVLVYFIHHIAESIQASTIISSVAKETLRAIDKTFPDQLEQQPDDRAEQCAQDALMHWYPIRSRQLGYLQTVDIDGLAAVAERNKTVIRMEKKVGDFIAEEQVLLSLATVPSEELLHQLDELCAVGHHRTVEQDIGVGIRQLVDIALRALSPALNDPATAAMCIDFLSAILARLASRRIDTENCFSDGALRVITKGPDFRSFLRESFDPICENADNNVSIYLRLLTMFGSLAETTQDAVRKRHIADQVNLVVDYANQKLDFAVNLARIERHRQLALAACRA
jgi:uncharacterized membrane protein